MPHIFTFGIPKLFDFTFRAGHQSSCLIEETVAIKSDANDSADPDATNQSKAIIPSLSEHTYPEANDGVKTLVPSPSFGTGYSASSPCGALSKLPLELRVMVYKSVLMFKKYIRHPHRFLDRHPPIMAEECKYLEAIDAALLRTCRAVYQEAVHILYGRNRFEFRNPRDIKTFAHVGLGDTPFGLHCSPRESASAVGNAPHGRFTMIRSMILKVDSELGGNDREKIWSFWCDFFDPPKEQDQLVGFPALQWLTLNLTDWGLGTRNDSKIRVKPFLKKLRPTGGLRHLTLIGVHHEQNLRDFKHGFVRQGGTFRPASCTVKTIKTTTVTHDELPEVSMYVRAIVEKDRASRAISQHCENATLGNSDQGRVGPSQ